MADRRLMKQEGGARLRSYRLSKDLIRRLDATAKRRGQPSAEVVRWLIREHLPSIDQITASQEA